MTQSKGKPHSTTSTQNSGANKPMASFVSCELSDAQRIFVKAHVPPIEESDDTLDRLLRDGYKLSVRFEERSMAIATWLTAPDSNLDNSGWLLSARGPSLRASLAVLFYKHFEILKEVWTTKDGPVGQRDTWG